MNKDIKKKKKTKSPISLAIRMVKMSVCQKYRGISIQSILVWIFCIAYFVSPIDVILDAIPFFGIVDDTAVLGWAVVRFKKEFEKFKEWDKKNTSY
ncbi:MAG: YkvA family protein [Bacteroidales bacterium]